MNENRLSEFLEFFDSEPTNKVFYITEKERKAFSSLIISCFLFDMVCEYYDKIDYYNSIITVPEDIESTKTKMSKFICEILEDIGNGDNTFRIKLDDFLKNV